MVGRTIRTLRQDAGLKQYELAARAKVHPQTINRIEKGHTTPDVATLQRLADAFGVPVGRLFSDHTTMTDEVTANTPAA